MTNKQWLWISLISIWITWACCEALSHADPGPFGRRWGDHTPYQFETSTTIHHHAAAVIAKVRELDELLKDDESRYAVMLLVADYYGGGYRLVPAYGEMTTTIINEREHYEREWIILDMDLRIDETQVIILQAFQMYDITTYFNYQEV